MCVGGGGGGGGGLVTLFDKLAKNPNLKKKLRGGVQGGK